MAGCAFLACLAILLLGLSTCAVFSSSGDLAIVLIVIGTFTVAIVGVFSSFGSKASRS